MTFPFVNELSMDQSVKKIGPRAELGFDSIEFSLKPDGSRNMLCIRDMAIEIASRGTGARISFHTDVTAN
jgi:hypothetical protein